MRDAGPEAIAERWRGALVARYPDRHRAKLIARDLGVELRTAEGWLSESAPVGPSPRALRRAGLRHGVGLLLEVLLPEADEATAARVAEQLGQVEQRLAELRQELAALERKPRS